MYVFMYYFSLPVTINTFFHGTGMYVCMYMYVCYIRMYYLTWRVTINSVFHSTVVYVCISMLTFIYILFNMTCDYQ